ncbi:AGE family epimerase/isomerase [Escherichia coli]|nr:AGE family epimerase/isomerase [Escherichia coli]
MTKKWLDRAIRVASVIIHDVARNNHYRVNEHFDTQWNPLPDYNKDNPAHRFRAFGGTPGHWIEWGPFNAAHPRGPGSPLRTTASMAARRCQRSV